MDSGWRQPDATGTLLSGQVAAYLRGYIAEHGLGPDDPLPGEAAISRTLGISRSVVREAAHGLAALGVIEVAPGRRPRVARVAGTPMRSVFEHALITGQANASQMLELRQGLEVTMAGHAAARRSAQAAEDLAAIVAQMGAALHNRAAYAELDLQFHLAIATATANPLYPLLISAGQTAFVRTMLVGLRSRSNEAELQRVQKLHEAILHAVVQQDSIGAAAAMTRHFEDARLALARIPAPTATKKARS
jgi:DNA-binding FadR family transcriptional regulator